MGLILWKQSAAQHIVTVYRTAIILFRKNAAAPRVARQWVRPRSSAMSIDVALSTRRGVGRDTYSLPKKTRLRREWHVNGHATTT